MVYTQSTSDKGEWTDTDGHVHQTFEIADMKDVIRYQNKVINRTIGKDDLDSIAEYNEAVESKKTTQADLELLEYLKKPVPWTHKNIR
jgi:hypothetical protein